MNRCVNIDWLEVFAYDGHEDEPRNPKFFESRGYEVKVREYGTPQYKTMFTIFEHGEPFIEIRRDPYSLKEHGGIFLQGDCHIRLCNKTCYLPSPINTLREFMIAADLRLKGITRIDICMDFNRFDYGDNPRKVLLDYMAGKLSKCNQTKIAAYGKDVGYVSTHGYDTFGGRQWNSVSWGGAKSSVRTRFYNKSLELRQVKEKFYIRDAWLDAGLETGCDVWRVEFAIKSDINHYIRLDTGELLRSDLNCYDDRHKLLFRFHSLANVYFKFKYVEIQDNGKPRRKDRCRDKKLFVLHKDEKAYKPIRITKDLDPTRTDKILINRLVALRNDQRMTSDYRLAADRMLQFFVSNMRYKESLVRGDDLMLLLFEQ